MEKTGFQTSGFIDKKGTNPEGLDNQMPPGEDISNQKAADIKDMPMRKVTDTSYLGDGQ